MRVQYAYRDASTKLAPVAQPTAPQAPTPAYGSLEWKIARREQLRGLIADSETKLAHLQHRYGHAHEQNRQRIAETPGSMRSQLYDLDAELGATA